MITKPGWVPPLLLSPWKRSSEIARIPPPPKYYIATGISEAKDHNIFRSCNAPKVSSAPSGTRTLYFFLSLLFCLFLKQEKTICLQWIYWVIFCVSHLQKIWLWSLIKICSLKTQSVNSDKCHCLSFSIRLKIFFLDHPETKLEAAVNWELTICIPERRISEQCDTEALGMDQCLAYALLEDSILMPCGTHCIGTGWSFWKK